AAIASCRSISTCQAARRRPRLCSTASSSCSGKSAAKGPLNADDRAPRPPHRLRRGGDRRREKSARRRHSGGEGICRRSHADGEARGNRQCVEGAAGYSWARISAADGGGGGRLPGPARAVRGGISAALADEE